ncbi:MAG TPA: 50S ribosomal protein L29 [Myxococcota bacterium]|jgi:large subunit ribosomal protein L29|nr:50S ribosomal protein L29 [Myxococcota bacterium]
MAKEIYETAAVLRERADDSLHSELVALEEKLWKARFDLRRGQLADTALVGKLRRQIARVESVVSERALAAVAKAAAKKAKKAAAAAAGGGSGTEGAAPKAKRAKAPKAAKPAAAQQA